MDVLWKVMRDDFEVFNKQRNGLDFKMVDLEKKMITMGDSKMSLKDAEESFKNMEERLSKEHIQNTKNRDGVTTLENYVERYIPMQILKTVTKVIRPLLTPE